MAKGNETDSGFREPEAFIAAAKQQAVLLKESFGQISAEEAMRQFTEALEPETVARERADRLALHETHGQTAKELVAIFNPAKVEEDER